MTDEVVVPDGEDVHVLTEEEIPSNVDPALQQVAREVIAGQWGRGLTRHRRLKEAGFDPNLIQKEVTKIFDQ